MRPERSQQPHPTPIGAPRTARVLGVPLALTDYDRTLDWIDGMVRDRGRGYVCVANVHTVTSSAEDPELRSALMSSSINVPDGQPLVWAMNALGP
jgi:N-acetylglucosaminyldiphosphoundecaprenol N-acetyl-beta-D-mannosaminyltransferase